MHESTAKIGSNKTKQGADVGRRKSDDGGGELQGGEGGGKAVGGAAKGITGGVWFGVGGKGGWWQVIG